MHCIIKDRTLARGCRVLGAFLLALVLLGRGGTAAAYTPESPEVVSMIRNALAFLQRSKSHGQLGGECLIGLTLAKNNLELSHPVIKRAIARCRTESKGLKKLTVYDIGLAIIFLCEAAERQDRDMIDKYLDELLRRQRSVGGWTYSDKDGGDTSQTQYAVLALWTAKNAGYQVHNQVIVKVCNWLLTTQDPSGGWVYHPNNPDDERRLTASLAAAGLGSLYVCADMLGIKTAPGPPKPEKGLPAVLVRVEEPVDDGGPETEVAGVPKQRVAAAKREGIAFMDRAYGNIFTGAGFDMKWPYYALYAVERYRSFREKAEKSTDNAWYDRGVEYLKSKQDQEDGKFYTILDGGGAEAQTCFAILFLMRSTKKSIGSLSQGQLKGGVGLPSNDSKMRLYGGRIVAAEVNRSLSELVELLEDGASSELSDLIQFSPETVAKMPTDPKEYAGHMQRLKGLAAHPDNEIRIVAVRALGEARDLDNVPVLIYALSDPNKIVVKAAREGLRFTSRKVDGLKESGGGGDADDKALIDAWKAWYLSIRPDAQFIEPGKRVD